MYLDDNGITVYEVTDSIDPLQGLLNAGMTSVSSLAHSWNRTFTNTTERDTEIPSPTDGMEAYTTSDNTKWIYQNGWVAWDIVPDDTGWVTCNVNSGYSMQGSGNELKVRRIAGVVFVEGGFNSQGLGQQNQSYPNVGSLPDSRFYPEKTQYLVTQGGTPNNFGLSIVRANGGIDIRTGSSTPGYFLFDGNNWLP